MVACDGNIGDTVKSHVMGQLGMKKTSRGLGQMSRYYGYTWISGCLSTATSSILINGSPTREFNISRGLRQGDPLSPFLFIIAIMEGPSMTPLKCKGAAEWSRDNIKCLVSILECFHRVSGLKINYRKSNLFGVGVPSIEVSQAALITEGYTKWKSSDAILGGRATLISSDFGSIGTYYLSLFPMPSTVNKKLESMRIDGQWMSLSGSPQYRKWRYLMLNIANLYNQLANYSLNDSDDDWTWDIGIETIQHTLWTCSLATTVWHRIFSWLQIPPPTLADLHDLYSWVDDLHISSSRRIILDTICGVVLWSLWNFRNETIFGTTHKTPPKPDAAI
ncbi:RNA-directed DNA polymerase, eukaryota, reverse transcriptase zinc-binding domain protein [Tanacetum coccineum]